MCIFYRYTTLADVEDINREIKVSNTCPVSSHPKNTNLISPHLLKWKFSYSNLSSHESIYVDILKKGLYSKSKRFGFFKLNYWKMLENCIFMCWTQMYLIFDGVLHVVEHFLMVTEEKKFMFSLQQVKHILPVERMIQMLYNVAFSNLAKI